MCERRKVFFENVLITIWRRQKEFYMPNERREGISHSAEKAALSQMDTFHLSDLRAQKTLFAPHKSPPRPPIILI